MYILRRGPRVPGSSVGCNLIGLLRITMIRGYDTHTHIIIHRWHGWLRLVSITLQYRFNGRNTACKYAHRPKKPQHEPTAQTETLEHGYVPQGTPTSHVGTSSLAHVLVQDAAFIVTAGNDKQIRIWKRTQVPMTFCVWVRRQVLRIASP